jgi:hypothetical protein
MVLTVYYGIDEDDAKISLLKAIYDVVHAPWGCDTLGVPPFMQTLGKECAAAKVRLAGTRPSFVEHFEAQGRPDPQASTMAYILMDKEHEVLKTIVDLLPSMGLRLVVPMFDGAVLAPADLANAGTYTWDLPKIAAAVNEKHGILVREKPFAKAHDGAPKRKRHD